MFSVCICNESKICLNLIVGSLFTITNGWGKTQESYMSGQYRIFAWKSLSAKSHIVQTFNLPSSSSNELRFSAANNQYCDIVQVMVRVGNKTIHFYVRGLTSIVDLEQQILQGFNRCIYSTENSKQS